MPAVLLFLLLRQTILSADHPDDHCPDKTEEDLLTSNNPAGIFRQTFHANTVLKVEYVGPEPWMMQAARAGVPVIVRNVPGLWAAVKKWDPNYLTDMVPLLKDGVEVGDSAELVFSDATKPLARIRGVAKHRAKPLKNVKTKDFFTFVADSTPKPNQFYYFHAPIAKVFPKLKKDLAKFDFCSAVSAGLEKEFSHIQYNLWMGGRNVTTHLHYDSFHNAYIQVHGRKRFNLLSPDQHLQVHVHPYLHPYSQQAQVNFTSEVRNLPSKFPLWRPTETERKTLQVDLNEGDVLYIPPFWFHHVSALEPSISVNTWCPSQAHTLRSAMSNQLPNHFLQSWGGDKAVALAFVVFINEMAVQCGLENFARDLYSSRYHPLFSESKAKPPFDFCGLTSLKLSDKASTTRVKKLRKEMLAPAKAVCAVLTRFETLAGKHQAGDELVRRRWRKSQAEIMLMDVVEAVANVGLPDTALIPPFFKFCLRPLIS